MARIQTAVILAAILAVGQSAKLWSHRIRLSPPDESNRRLKTSDGQANPYSGFGMHFLQMYLGNPAQMRTLAVSTAGAFTALPCEDCVDCGPRGKNLFNFTGSKGFTVSPCSDCSQGSPCFNDRCAVGASTRDSSTWSGYEVSDYVFHGGGGDQMNSIVGTDAAEMFGFPLRFVCQTRTRGFFNNVMDGVLGLSPSPTSFLSQMHAAGKLEHPRFSLCFNDVEYSNREAGTGVVTFGGFKQSFVETEMVYAKKLEGDVYKVNIKKIHLRVGGGRSVRSDAQEKLFVVDPPVDADSSAVVDSSTPFLTFDKRFEEPFRAAWREATGQEFTHARQTLTAEELGKMPTLLIELEGDSSTLRELDPSTVPSLTNGFNVLVAVPAIHYLEHMVTGVRPYRARIHFESEKGSLLGANLMQGHTVSYEPDLNRIGFAESRQCETGGSGGGGRTGAGEGGDEADNAEAGGSTSLATSGGVIQQAAPVATTSNAGTAVSVGTDDDLFVSGEQESFEESKKDEDDLDGGSCFTASCRSFMAIAYVFIGTALAVVYRVSRPKERLGSDLLHQYSVEEAQG
eukprot:CAMPEP_0119009382 /NCGR_PEP_ID=MMETSP1176-20130426/4327_1 /TAXON_ID=265551 /ORGANISM="Synedropsis recta cf, Strain CCMP1620" /LENGTH=568 /DNA_ID=CAMNT_0006961891 /DNA_START=43 /DNA_END=1745 /DNA_ORIENTATION=-